MKVIFLLFVFIIFITNLSCNKEESNPNQASQYGIILGKVTQNNDIAISGASIETNPPSSSVITNMNGEYTINDIPIGTYLVTASKTGFISNAVNVSVNADKITIANIQLNIDKSNFLQPPILFSPVNGSKNQNTSLVLIWNTSNNATSYNLKVALDSLFNNIVFNQSILSGNSQQIDGLQNNTIYYWRVSAVNNLGISDWSNYWCFTTAQIIFTCGSTITYLNKTYNTVQIGSQCWLKENLDVGIFINANVKQINNGIIEKYCYKNDSANCNLYGGLYQWVEAVQYKNGTTDTTLPNPAFSGNVQGICPNGWHLPNYSEFQTLCSTVSNDGNALKAVGEGIDSGRGTNFSGFSALIAGMSVPPGGFYPRFFAVFWCSTANDPLYATSLGLYVDRSKILIAPSGKNYGYSVRCLKDD